MRNVRDMENKHSKRAGTSSPEMQLSDSKLLLSNGMTTNSHSSLIQTSAQQGLLATYVILGCIWRGFKCGCESSSDVGSGGLSGKGERGGCRTRRLKSKHIQNIAVSKMQIAKNASEYLLAQCGIAVPTFGHCCGIHLVKNNVKA